jgi:6-phosphogluconolactonase/glucosamine-6-phosphate isomerase/deaminase
VLVEARLSVVLARGATKREALRTAQSSNDVATVPASLLRRCAGRVMWVIDEGLAL